MLKNFAFVLLLASYPAFAHEAHHHDHPAVEVDFTQAKLELREDQIQSLIHQSHEVIEGDESGGFLKRWRDAFDFKARFVDGLRWSSSVGDTRYRDLAVDSLFLFGLSHGTEMLSGPVLLAVGAANHWPDWVMGTIAGGGTLISIPGLDPLCMVAFAFYAKSPGFRGGVGWLRLASVKAAHGVARATRMNDYVAKIFARPELGTYLENLDGLTAAVVDEDGSIDFTFNRSGLTLTVHFANGVAYLEDVHIDRDTLAGADSRELKAFTRQFGWNARDFIKSVVREGRISKPYVTESSVDHAVLAPNAIAIRAQRSCESRLQSVST